MTTRKPRIGVFTRPIDQGDTGSGHHALEMLRHIRRLDHGYELTAVHYDQGTEPAYEGLPELVLPRNPFAASRLVQRAGFDLLHYTQVSIFAPVWGVTARKTATIHNAETAITPRYLAPVQALHESFAVRPYAQRMETIITVSEASRRFLATLCRMPEERFVICSNGTNPNYRVLSGDAITAPARYGVTGEYILHISRYSPRKNPWTLLKAFARLKTARPELQLVIAGAHWLNEKVADFVREHHLERSVIFTGFAPEQDIVELLNGARAFVFPSLSEGFGMPNIEAMACGCPVVTSNEFAIPEVVGDAALMTERTRDDAELATAVARVLDDAELAADLRRKGLERIQRFSWVESAKRMVQVWDETLAGARKG